MKARPVCLLTVLLFVAANHVVHADWRVWTVAKTKHVLRSEPPGRDLAVKVAAARNEWVSFQILLRSDEPVKTVRLEADNLHAPAGAVLNQSESRLYRQHQLYIEVGTQRNDAHKPDWYPDPLIPFRHPVPGKKLEAPRFVAIPFDLPANETHGFWVDLYVPAETAPGDYHGIYHITADGGKNVDIPIALTVWNFTLPQTPTLVTAFGSPVERMRGYYRQRVQTDSEREPSDWPAVEAECAQLLSEHRLNATPPAEMFRPAAQPDGSFQIPSQQVQALQEFVDRYHVNALEVRHPSSVIKDPNAQRDMLRAWLAAFDRAAKELNRPHIVFYIYLKDEPNTREDYQYVQRWGRAVREAKSVVQVLVVEQTWTEAGKGGADSAWGDLYGTVDIWCPLFSLHRQDSASRRQTLGETVWAYTALCQGPPTPWWHIDYPLLNYRVPAWMAWRDRMKGLLYWGGMSYWRETDDPWLHVPIYTGRGVIQQGKKGIQFNGEGSLVYPARAVGYDGIVPTLRLKALRDAVEDYEYLAMLNRLGKSKEADQIVRRLTESWFQWEKDPAAYETARAELAALIVAAAEPRPAKPTQATGPLRVHPANPRYFTDGTRNADGSLKAVYLTGSHTWNNLVDIDKADPPAPFDFEAYLDSLQRYGHNFIRLWTWDSVTWDTRANRNLGKDFVLHCAPLPWARTGPGQAIDGKPKFDLTKFNPEYFDRLRARVSAAGNRGIYVSVMLFEGWGLRHGDRNRPPAPDGWAYRSHPFHPDNNINGITGDLNGDGHVLEVHSLAGPAVTALQEAYIRKVVDTVHDLDNVLFEVANEGGEKEWNWWVVKTVHDYEQEKPKQHPVGITGHGGERLATMLTSPADWLSPGGQDGYGDPAPPWDGSKVSLLDTDHIWGVGGSPAWVWKSFLRGHNPIFMDPYDGSVLGTPSDRRWEPIRAALGATRRLAERMNLAAMTPRKELASSGYCLADPGKEYLVYLPEGGEATVDLTAVSGQVVVEWIHPVDGTAVPRGEISGGAKRSLQPPFTGDAVLYLKTQAQQTEGPDIAIPPSEHPRLYLRAEHVAQLPQRLKDPVLQPAVERLQAQARNSLQFKVEWDALQFLVTRDAELGRATIESALSLLQKCELPNIQDACRVTGRMMVTGAIVYDWCYSLLTPQDKQMFIQELVRLAKTEECGYPPTQQGSVTGHSSEAMIMRDMLSAGIAIYDEFPEMYRLAAGRFFREHLPARNWFYSGQAYHQGDSYGPHRFSWDTYPLWIFDRLGEGNVYNPQQRFVPYLWIYTTRPDGQRLRAGDTFAHSASRGQPWSQYIGTLLTAGYYGDGLLLDQYQRQGGSGGNETIFEVLWRDISLEPKSIRTLPLSRYFGSPFGWMVARTGWGEDAVIAEMKINEYNFVNHQHLDAGAFQIYYKGALAVDSGLYQGGSSGDYGSPHCMNYYWRTIAHNSLLVYDPNEDFGRRGYGNDGGQRLPNGRSEARNLSVLLAPGNGYRTGKVLAHGFGPDPQTPDFTLLQGDLTDAYSKKVRQVTRSFVFLNLRNPQVPAAIVVFDRIVSANPAFRKYWLLHTLEEPHVDSASVVIDCTQHGNTGRLTLDVLLPAAANAELTKVGGPGKEYWVFGQNYTNDVDPKRLERTSMETGAWRIELSPKTAAAEDLFLNVVQITDHQSPSRRPVQHLDTGERAGCIIEGPDSAWIVLMRKDSRRSAEPVKLTAPGQRPGRILVTDLEPGQWHARREGSAETRDLMVSEDSGSAWLDGLTGTWTLSR